MKAIKGFFDEYRFLSNFWPARVVLDGVTYRTVEHAYQAAKTLNREVRQVIAELPKAGDAKRAGRRLTLRPHWDKIKVTIMVNLLRQKFTDPHLKQRLLDTGDAYLEETNGWGDRFWGVCDMTGAGENWLGKLLMQVRTELAGVELNNILTENQIGQG